MTRKQYRKVYSILLLSILFAANVGQKLHIYHEDLLHFEAFCKVLAPDNGASEKVIERCIVDDYNFYPYLLQTAIAPDFFFEFLAVVRPQETSKARFEPIRGCSRRAPPVVCHSLSRA